MENKNLIVRKASAGSGKTYSLAQHYLKIVLTSTENKAFSRIMAMTFTNKATLEMKERVIHDLVSLAYPVSGDKKAASLLASTVELLGIDPMLIQERSQKVLKNILHNYGELSIMTIDKFNVRLVRTFTKDLDLPVDFEIILNADELQEKIVDQLIEGIGKEGHKKLSKLLIEFSKQNVDDQKHWDFKKSLLEFLKEVEKEHNAPIIEELEKREYDEKKKKEIFQRLAVLEKEYELKRDALVAELNNNGWESKSFSPYLTGIFNRIIALSSKDLNTVSPLTEVMITSIQNEKTNPRTKVPLEYVIKAEAFFNWIIEIQDEYSMLTHVKNSFYQLALIKNITTLLNEVRKKENIIRISEFNLLISKLIHSESAPYIYERIGTRFDHYLLDEFQDTSRLQWRNLIPLVHESLSSGNSNFIVGDTKQAIYRFRNGLVEQFAALPEIYNPENIASLDRISTYFNETSDVEPLKDNYRSKKEIVEFNNALFSELRNALRKDYQTYYNDEDLLQNPKLENGGLVSVTETSEPEGFVLKAVADCIEDGFKPGEICFLVDENKYAVKWAHFLIDHGYKVISDEALKIGSSTHVQCVINYINYRKQPTILSAQLLFIESYYSLAGDEDVLTKINELKAIQPKNMIAAFADKEFGGLQTFNFPYENLYDLGQKLLRLLRFNEMKNPYLHHLCDMLQAFDLKNGPNITDFIEYYNGKGHKESVALADSPDSIRIMTVHKSKGLEFPVVILPKIKWTTNFKISTAKFLFHDTNYDEIYIAGTKATPGIGATSYQVQQNTKEIDAIKLDKMNQFYVACTRATERLYFSFSPKPKTNTIESIYVSHHDKIKLLSPFSEDTYTYGARSKHAYKGVQSSSFLPITKEDRLWFPDISLIDKESLDKEDLQQERRFGSQFHLLLSELVSKEDVTIKLDELIKSNQIESIFKEKMYESISKMMDNKEILNLLFPQNNETILNECEVVVAKGTRIRPDRVIISGKKARIIDFKTGLPKKKDHTQVANYQHALQSMGYDNCEGYLVYTDTQKIVQVS